jgi:hypothetical protein
MLAVFGKYRWGIVLFALVVVLVAGAQSAMADTPQATFTGTVYYKNYPAANAAVTVVYAGNTFTKTADSDGNYTLVTDYIGSAKATLTASYNGDTDTFTWIPTAGVATQHDFWIVPRPVQPSYAPDVEFSGHVYIGDRPAKDAHVIIVYGSYILDTYANETGHYDLLIYYQGKDMPARLWATYGDGKSDDSWKSPWPNSKIMTDMVIKPGTMPGLETPEPTPVNNSTTSPIEPTAAPSGTATPKLAGVGTVEGLMIVMVAIGAASSVMSRRQ